MHVNLNLKSEYEEYGKYSVAPLPVQIYTIITLSFILFSCESHLSSYDE
jgi:hypothetical protein